MKKIIEVNQNDSPYDLEEKLEGFLRIQGYLDKDKMFTKTIFLVIEVIEE